MEINRRRFIQWTLGSAIALTGSVLTIQYLQNEDLDRIFDSSDYSWRFFIETDRIVLLAIVPVFLGPELAENVSEQGLVNFMQHMDQIVSYFSLNTQSELRQLFDLLWSRLGKVLLAGIWSSWSDVSMQSVTDFIQHWRDSWLTVLNQGYIGIQQLIMAGVYSNENSWPAINYQGPPF